MTDKNDSQPSTDGRRTEDRRKAQAPFDGPERRQSDRRSGSDRRTTPRADGTEPDPV